MDLLGKLMPVGIEIWIRHLFWLNRWEHKRSKGGECKFAKREPTTVRNAPKTSHIHLHRGKTMTFHDVMCHDVMEAAVFKESKQRKWASDSRVCSMEIKTVFVIHTLMSIIGGKTNLFNCLGYISDF